MSVNPLLLITHCQDENRQLISFWNEYSWRSVLGGICCWSFKPQNRLKSLFLKKIIKIVFSLPTPGGWYPKGHVTKFNPKGSGQRKEKSYNFGQNAPAQNDLIGSKNGQNCTHTVHVHLHTRVCALNVSLSHPIGVWYHPFGGGKGAGKPKADRAIRKRKENVT